MAPRYLRATLVKLLSVDAVVARDNVSVHYDIFGIQFFKDSSQCVHFGKHLLYCGGIVSFDRVGEVLKYRCYFITVAIRIFRRPASCTKMFNNNLK